MHNRTFADIEVPEADPERWAEQIKQYARNVRAKLRAHRDLARVSMRQMPFTREMLPRVEQVFALFHAAGLPDDLVQTAADMISTYVDGFAYEESLWEERNPNSEEYWGQVMGQLGDYFASLPPDRFPTLVALSKAMFTSDNDERFERGLDIILRGLATYLER